MAPPSSTTTRRPRERGQRWLVASTAVAAPLALGVETLVRRALFPSTFEDVRQFLRPTLTPIAWALGALALLAGLAGVALQLRLERRTVARAPAGADPNATEERARVGSFLLAASVPQIPAVLATITFTLGASLTAVLSVIALSTAFVCVQAVRVAR